MRRTALLVSATLSTGLPPRASGGIAAAAAKPFADADHLLLTGRYGAAVEKLRAA